MNITEATNVNRLLDAVLAGRLDDTARDAAAALANKANKALMAGLGGNDVIKRWPSSRSPTGDRERALRADEGPRGGYQRIKHKGGSTRIHVGAHAKAPTFTFDVVVEGPDAPLICTNLTRAELVEHLRLCQKALGASSGDREHHTMEADVQTGDQGDGGRADADGAGPAAEAGGADGDDRLDARPAALRRDAAAVVGVGADAPPRAPLSGSASGDREREVLRGSPCCGAPIVAKAPASGDSTPTCYGCSRPVEGDTARRAREAWASPSPTGDREREALRRGFDELRGVMEVAHDELANYRKRAAGIDPIQYRHELADDAVAAMSAALRSTAVLAVPPSPTSGREALTREYRVTIRRRGFEPETHPISGLFGDDEGYALRLARRWARKSTSELSGVVEVREIGAWRPLLGTVESPSPTGGEPDARDGVRALVEQVHAERGPMSPLDMAGELIVRRTVGEHGPAVARQLQAALHLVAELLPAAPTGGEGDDALYGHDRAIYEDTVAEVARDLEITNAPELRELYEIWLAAGAAGSASLTPDVNVACYAIYRLIKLKTALRGAGASRRRWRDLALSQRDDARDETAAGEGDCELAATALSALLRAARTAAGGEHATVLRGVPVETGQALLAALAADGWALRPAPVSTAGEGDDTRCPMCGGLGWTLDCNDLGKLGGRMVELIPCFYPTCRTAPQRIESLCFKGIEFERVATHPKGWIMAVKRGEPVTGTPPGVTVPAPCSSCGGHLKDPPAESCDHSTMHAIPASSGEGDDTREEVRICFERTKGSVSERFANPEDPVEAVRAANRRWPLAAPHWIERRRATPWRRDDTPAPASSSGEGGEAREGASS